MSLTNTVAEILPAWFKSTAIGQSMVEAQRAKDFEDRQRHVERLEALRRDLAATTAKVDEVEAPVRAAALAARTKAEAAETKWLAIQRTNVLAASDLRQSIARAERLLMTSADPRIEAAKRAMEDRFARERDTMGRSRTVRDPGKVYGTTRKPAESILSNERAIRRLLAAMAAARPAFDRLKVANPPDVLAAIATIDATVPWDQLDTLEPVGASSTAA